MDEEGGHPIRQRPNKSPTERQGQVQRETRRDHPLQGGGEVPYREDARLGGSQPTERSEAVLEREELPGSDRTGLLQEQVVRFVRQLQLQRPRRSEDEGRENSYGQGDRELRHLLVCRQAKRLRQEDQTHRQERLHQEERDQEEQLQLLQQGTLHGVRLQTELHQVPQGLQDGHVPQFQREVLLREPHGLREGVPAAGGEAAQLAEAQLLRRQQCETDPQLAQGPEEVAQAE